MKKYIKVIVILLPLVLIGFFIHTIFVIKTNVEFETELKKFRSAGLFVSLKDIILQNPNYNLKPEENVAELFYQLKPDRTIWKNFDPKKIINDFKNNKKTKENNNIRQIVKNNKKTIDLLYEISKYKGCFFTVNENDPFLSKLPDLMTMREAMTIFAMHIIVKGTDKGFGYVIPDIKTSCKIMNLWSDQPFLITSMVVFAGQEINLYLMDEVLNNISIDRNNFQELWEELDNIETRTKSSLAYSLNAEACVGLIYMDPNYILTAQTKKILMEVGINKYSWYYHHSYLARPLLNKDRAFYLRCVYDFINITKKDKFDFNKQKEIQKSVSNIPSTYLFSKSIIEDLTPTIKEIFGYISNIRTLKIKLMLAYYKSMKHIHPTSLEELGKEIKMDVPKDPLTGADYIYKLQGTTFELSSPK